MIMRQSVVSAVWRIRIQKIRSQECWRGTSFGAVTRKKQDRYVVSLLFAGLEYVPGPVSDRLLQWSRNLPENSALRSIDRLLAFLRRKAPEQAQLSISAPHKAAIPESFSKNFAAVRAETAS